MQGWPGFPRLTHRPSHSPQSPNPEPQLVLQSCQFCTCAWGTRAHANRPYQAESCRLEEEETGAIVFLLWKAQPLHFHLRIVMESPTTTTAISPERTPAPSKVSPTQFLSFQSLILQAQIKYSGDFSVLPALIDSGVAANFIDPKTAIQLKFPSLPLQHPLHIRTIDRGPISTETITQHQTHSASSQ